MISTGSGLKTRASQRHRNIVFPTSEMKTRLTKFPVGCDPPTMLCPGAGDDERSHDLKLNNGIILYYTRMMTAQLLDPPALAIVSGPR
jgi:hypothetical protein